MQELSKFTHYSEHQNPTYCLKNNANIFCQLTPINVHTCRAEEQSGCTRTAGPYGGGGGGAFHEFIDGCHAIVRKIIIRSGRLIDAIQVTYKKRNGRLYTSRQRGGNGGGKSTIILRRGEIIVGIFGKTGRLVDQLGFVTNHGRIFGPYGGNGGGSFKVHGCHLRGIFGRSGSLIDSIGFYCSSVPKCSLG